MAIIRPQLVNSFFQEFFISSTENAQSGLGAPSVCSHYILYIPITAFLSLYSNHQLTYLLTIPSFPATKHSRILTLPIFSPVSHLNDTYVGIIQYLLKKKKKNLSAMPDSKDVTPTFDSGMQSFVTLRQSAVPTQ